MKQRLLFLPLLAVLSACGDGAPGSAEGVAAPRAGTPPLDADGLPLFRAGLWEDIERRGGETETRRQCRAAGVDKATRDFLAGAVRPECVRTRDGSGAAMTVSLQCKAGEMTIGTTIQLSGDETHARSSMVTSVTGPDGTPARETVTGESRWLSPCPEGLAAGDEVAMDEAEIDP